VISLSDAPVPRLRGHVRCSQVRTDGRSMSECQGKCPDQPLHCRAGDSIHPYRAPILQQGRKSANIHAKLGFIWGMSD